MPPAFRKKLGVDRMETPLLLVEERDGGVFLQPAAAVPVRDIPLTVMEEWIAEDEEDVPTGLDEASR